MSAGWIWISIGATLMLLELLIPGMVVVFLGMAAVVVGVCSELGWVTTVTSQLLLWFGGSLAMVFGLRGLLQSWFPGEEERAETDEDRPLVGRRVPVTEDCGKDTVGRVLIGGVEWDARTERGVGIPAGGEAELVRRENLTWWVRPVTGRRSVRGEQV